MFIVDVTLCLMPCFFFVQTVHHNAYHNDPYAKEFGIKISDRLAQVEARILPAPWVFIPCDNYHYLTEFFLYLLIYVNVNFPLQLKYNDTGREKDCLPQVGQWNMMNKVICFFFYLHMLEATDEFK